MAVAKIRKFSSWSLLIVAIISAIIIVMFFVGGDVDAAAAKPEPVYTGLLLNWTYILFGISVLAVIIFGIGSFIGSFVTKPKSAIMSIVVLILFIALLLITYSLGSAEPLKLSADFKEYNTAFWLKLSDMWLYSTYILIALAIVGVVWGGIKSMLQKK